MNEIYNYDPETYHATLTHSVYVRLEGSTLRLSKPNKNISRRAVYNEPKPEVTYVSQKIYELTESKVSVPSLHLILTEYFFHFFHYSRYVCCHSYKNSSIYTNLQKMEEILEKKKIHVSL